MNLTAIAITGIICVTLIIITAISAKGKMTKKREGKK